MEKTVHMTKDVKAYRGPTHVCMGYTQHRSCSGVGLGASAGLWVRAPEVTDSRCALCRLLSSLWNVFPAVMPGRVPNLVQELSPWRWWCKQNVLQGLNWNERIFFLFLLFHQRTYILVPGGGNYLHTKIMTYSQRGQRSNSSGHQK